MSKFTLTIKQLEKLLRDANSNENQEDMVTFEVKNGRLLVTQKDWSNSNTKTLMNKPC